MATVPADPLNPGATRDYCKVLGAVQPIDPNAPPVNFEVNLPADWNGKAVQYGGGGSNGVLITGLAPLRDARRDTPVPVARAGLPAGALTPATTTDSFLTRGPLR
jgi:hypothetical protein